MPYWLVRHLKSELLLGQGKIRTFVDVWFIVALARLGNHVLAEPLWTLRNEAQSPLLSEVT